ncbi:MAG: hypothetical protein PWP49_133 [Thermococcaceae archaeon]|uniref:hypothetical protein n=1 Tax=Thermococcus sp. PK TaxID=913025 RepID=UPI0005B27E29|nr:hypothetical protein [Thermococcus sp. PK]KUJ99951.1 MAG: hypothetical protein XD43_0378 [Thermococcales archaeon 44_46]MDK2853183.1 hypothetical protein [Thermococcaceae archaeon]MDN5319713.1 hypothetical protein [Thermococcaceae archaeon]HIH73524.1 hypothetical protein [Thermococcaceae archaeon]
MLQKITYLIEKRRVKQHLNKIRTGKPSLSRYYAAYLFDKPLWDVTPDEIYRAERTLIPLVLKYYLTPSLNWNERVKLLVNELEEFYRFFCKRTKILEFRDSKNPLDNSRELENLVRFINGDHTVEEFLRWCNSPVPRSKYAFVSLLHKTEVADIEKLIETNIITKEQLSEIYRRRRSKLIPAVRRAIEMAIESQFSNQKPEKRRKIYRPNKHGSGKSVFHAYLEISGLTPGSYIEERNIEWEFKQNLVRMWFTSKNRHERENRLEQAFPRLLQLVSYTTIWYYIREQVDEYLIASALSKNEIEEYLRVNRHRLGDKMRTKLIRAYYFAK